MGALHVELYYVHPSSHRRQIFFAATIIYFLSLAIVKVSIICFYRRIFGMNWAMWASVFVSVAYFISCTVALILMADPPSYFWRPFSEQNIGRNRYGMLPFYIGSTLADLLSDLMILVVPIPLVWNLQMATFQKISVSILFLLGGLYGFPVYPECSRREFAKLTCPFQTVHVWRAACEYKSYWTSKPRPI